MTDGNKNGYSIELLSVQTKDLGSGQIQTLLETDGGTIPSILHPASTDSASAVVWVGGAGGGLFGPAGGMYPRLAGILANEDIASLRLDYRYPNNLMACVIDTLVAVAYLQSLGFTRIILVGHSFGGAVAINAGAVSAAVAGVATLSTQNAGTETVDEISPRPLLLLHGAADRVLSDRVSREIYIRALDPKEIKIYPGCGHGLDECRQQVDEDLLDWIHRVFSGYNHS